MPCVRLFPLLIFFPRNDPIECICRCFHRPSPAGASVDCITIQCLGQTAGNWRPGADALRCTDGSWRGRNVGDGAGGKRKRLHFDGERCTFVRPTIGTLRFQRKRNAIHRRGMFSNCRLPVDVLSVRWYHWRLPIDYYICNAALIII